MGRREKGNKILSSRIDGEVRDEFLSLFEDPLTGKTKYGEPSAVVEKLLRNYLKEAHIHE